MTEQIFEDFHHAHGLNTVSLRYFNAAGADPDGELGEAHNPETHLIPRLIFTALKQEEEFTVYNDTLNTPDGTAIRDYIHVTDLANAHVSALHWLKKNQKPEVFNLGAGKGYSVWEIIEKTKEITGCSIKVKVDNQKIAELPTLVADTTKAKEQLNWTPQYSLDEIIETAWKWHSSKILAKV